MIFRNRNLVKSGDLNGANSLFGGRVLAWIDEEAAIFAMCQLGRTNLVTKAISTINFKAPARLGDIIEIGCEVVRFGTTSIIVRCTVRNKTTQNDIVTVDEIVFVVVGDDGRPVAHGITQIRES